MKAENLELLIAVLKKAEGFTSAAALSKMVHVDKRTIRNYVNELNRGGKYTIESSAQGYRLVRRPGDGGGRRRMRRAGGSMPCCMICWQMRRAFRCLSWRRTCM